MSPQVNSIPQVELEYKQAPGTEILYDVAEDGTNSNRLHGFQHVKSGDGHLLLVPQPSTTDPNDPLRWSALKKWVTLLNAFCFSFMGSVTGPIMTGWMVDAAAFYDTSIQRMTYTVGATLITQGVATTLWIKTTYTSYLLGRTFLGIFEAPIESIVPSTITDIFFLHDRGAKVSLYGLSVLGGNELGPMLSAVIIQNLGMDYTYYIVAGIIFLNSITQFFFMPETMYLGIRPKISIQETSEDANSSNQNEKSSSHIQHDEVKESPVSKKTYWQELPFWSTNDTSVSLWQAFARPFVLLSYPTVIWSCCVYGLALSWNVILASTNGQLFAPPPYSFSPAAQGLIFTSPLIGSLIGTYLCGPVADAVANYFTRRNHGIREPEMRLPTCIIAAALTFLGALVAGLCYHFQTHWAGPVVGYGILSTGGQMGATLAMSYALDCHKELSVELMVTVASVKSAVAWIWTWVINDWLIRSGPLVVLMVIATVNMVVYSSTIIFYLKGKNIRIWIHKKDFLRACGVASKR